MTETECMNPECGEEATETYWDMGDNALKVCSDCYFQLVSRGRVVKPDEKPTTLFGIFR